jgi:RHS repeat-associated protein
MTAIRTQASPESPPEEEAQERTVRLAGGATVWGGGWYNSGFRDYSPMTMRFTTTDPIRSGSNWYAYVNGDPVNYVDPWGLSGQSEQPPPEQPSEPSWATPAAFLQGAYGVRLSWPVAAGTMTSGYGSRPVNSITTERGARVTTSADHSGLDIANVQGTAVLASAAGTVTRSGYNVYLGNYVEIAHGDAQVVATRYAHLGNPATVAVGDRMRAGQQVGSMGSTGASTGSHLHFELRIYGNTYDPELFLPERPEAIVDGTGGQGGGGDAGDADAKKNH